MKETCNVTNKSAGQVIYSLPDERIRRVFAPKEKKVLEVKELEKLVQRGGGKELFYNFLQVDDIEIANYLINGEVAPEYKIKEADMPAWMNECSLPEFQDALDFAPQGMIDIIKKLAVDMPLNDYSKREAIKEQLGFDVSKALEMKKASEENAAVAPTKPAGRRVAITTDTAEQGEQVAAQRRVIKS